MENQNEIKQLSQKQIIKIIVAAAALIIGILDMFKIINLSPFQGSAAIISFTVILWLAASEILKIHESRAIRFFRKMLVISAVLELTLFQFPSYNMLFGNYTQKTYLCSDIPITASYDNNAVINSDTSSLTIMGKGEVTCYLNDINQEIKTIKINLKYGEKTKRVNMTVDMADETNKDFRYSIASGSLVKDNENSNYIPCQFSGKVSQMNLKFSCDNDYDTATLQSVVFNEPIPFDVSAVRFLFLSFVISIGYGIVVSAFLRKPYEKNRAFCWTSVLSLTACAVVLATSVIIEKIPEDKTFKSRFELNSGDQITQEIVDAFENKQINLLKEPSQELLDLENPYDWSQRSTSGAYAEWDHVLYDGKYYSYYGIAPVITLFLPYHQKTGHYFATDMAVWIFSCIGLVFLGLTYMAIVKRWFRKVPSGCILSGAVILFAACGIWFSVGRTIFYEISISSGFMYLLIAAYCLISSNLLSNGKISLPRVAISSLCAGLAVLSRPTLAVYAVCAVLFYILNIKRSGQVVNKKTGKVKIKILRRIIYILCAVLPIGALAALQMWYNYERFGSIFDFGINYSLTINDFTSSQFHLIFVIIGLFNYIFAAPQFITDYPYIKTPFSKFNVNGYYFSDVGNTSGIIFLAFPVLGYMFGFKALKKLPTKQDKIKYSLMIGLPCVIMPLVIIFSIWESGYAVRYTADFSWQIIIGALAILFFLYTKSQNEVKKKLFRIFMAVSMIAAIIINTVQIIYFSFSETDYPHICRQLTDIIAFWR